MSERTESSESTGSPAPLAVLRPYLRLIQGLRGWYALSLLLGLVTLVATVGLLALSGWFLSAAAVAGLSLTTAQAFNFFYPGAGVRGLALTRTAGRWAERVVSHEATFRLLARVRVWLLARLFPLSPRQVGVYHGADLLQRFMRDVEQLDGLLPRLALPALALTLGLLLLALVLGWALPGGGALVPLTLLALLMALAPLLWHLGQPSSRAWVARRAVLRRRLIDAADGAGVLAFHASAWSAARNRALAASTAALHAQWQHERLGAFARAGAIAVCGLAAWATLLLWGGRVDGPLLVAIVLLLLGLAEIAAPVVTGLAELPAMTHAAQRLDDITGQTPDVIPPASGPQPVDGTVDIHGLDFAWDAHTPVLRGLTLQVPSGAHCFLSGPSGCGKSSLVQLLARFERPTQGQIHLGGAALDDLDEATLRRTLAVSSQFAWARQGTLADNLRIAVPDATPEQMLQVLALVGLADTVTAWPEGLDTWIDEGGQSLSGGQLRRLGVARALLRQAPITVLDEPTEGLDDAAAELLAERICAWNVGRTLIWISHRPQGRALFGQRVDLARDPA
ncbi:thiol reductant ABC exporter subunit CydC [Amphibiibacter pelophylacis]|uniref:Thiol reductant ABC exporter subunit CydC n=1 Tax=Amphibiibacter pelophylacis TaxID=1799477 RepID=A0ACC6P579_9BURK